MNELEATPIRGTEGGRSPFFSPDGQWIGFWAGGELKRVPLIGGPPQRICSTANPYGVTWGPDDKIFFGDVDTENILKVSATGGKPEVVISLDPEAGETNVALPKILPDGDTLLLNVMTGAGFDNAHIVAQSLDTNERRVVLDGGSQPRYLPTGYLVYLRENTLLAVSFDPASLEVRGSSVPLVEQRCRRDSSTTRWKIERPCRIRVFGCEISHVKCLSSSRSFFQTGSDRDKYLFLGMTGSKKATGGGRWLF